MYHAPGRRSRPERGITRIEVVCIVLAVAAVIALLVWIVSTAGGGALMT